MKLKQNILLPLVLVSAMTQANENITQQSNQWYKAAQQTLQENIAIKLNTKRAKNVIILVADGNGVGTNYATRIWQGQKNGLLGEEYVLPQEKFPHIALVKTYNTNAQTPDSAGTGTAMHSGVKTKAGMLGVDDSVVRGDCSAVAAGSVDSIAEILAKKGKAIGIISTARLTHATPASVYAHSADRNFEDNTKLPEGCVGQKDIAVQLIEKMASGEVDFAMGGGRRHFLPKDVKDGENKSGRRTDGKNLIEKAQGFGAQYAWDQASFDKLDTSGDKPVLALFESSHMKYEHDRTNEPSLAQMVEKGIKTLSNNKQGYFLHVEAGRVDHASHDGNAHRAMTDGAAFMAAVKKAVELTNSEDTLIIVTADHEHAIAFNGYCGRGTPITGLCMGIDTKGTKHTNTPEKADDGKPYTVLGYLNGSGSVLKEDQNWTGTRPALTQADAIDPDYIQQALIPKSSETHSGEDVAVYASGPWAHLFNGTVEQNYIFHVMLHAATN
ncbi:MAG: alkaline phosphatase [Oceanospirillaceae bacterium]|nr:alkaline phosphatase [Oceanospirillaceae bacterium]